MKRQNSGLLFIIAFLITTIGVVSCEKSKPTIQPPLEFLQASSYDVSQGDLLAFRLRVNGKKEDFTDSVWMKAFTNYWPNNQITVPYNMPDFPEINLRFRVGVFDGGGTPIWPFNLSPGIDTTRFQFWIRNKTGNIIHSVEAPNPILIRNN